jgi:hypothetical protein
MPEEAPVTIAVLPEMSKLLTGDAE